MMRMMHLFKKPLFITGNTPNAYITDENTQKSLPTGRKPMERGHEKNIQLQNGRMQGQVRGKASIIKKKIGRLKCHGHLWRNVEKDEGINAEKLKMIKTGGKMDLAIQGPSVIS